MIIVLANYVIDKWVREKMLCGVDLTISYLAFLVFWVSPSYSLHFPSVFNRVYNQFQLVYIKMHTIL